MPPDLALSSTLLFRTNFHGPKGVRAIEVRLYLLFTFLNIILCGFHCNFVFSLLYYLARTPQMPFPTSPAFKLQSQSLFTPYCRLTTSSSVYLFFLLAPQNYLSLLSQKTLRRDKTTSVSSRFFQNQEFVIFSNGCFNLPANILISGMVRLYNMQNIGRYGSKKGS